MRNLYKISYYKYAPESFKGFVKDNSGWHLYPLSYADATDCGFKSATKGYGAGLAHFKHVVRRQTRPKARRVTYGFMDLNDPGQFIFCRELSTKNDDLQGKLQLLKQIKSTFSSGVRLGGKATLGAAGKIEAVDEYTAHANLSRPIKIYLV